jgi:hypothetical protein
MPNFSAPGGEASATSSLKALYLPMSYNPQQQWQHSRPLLAPTVEEDLFAGTDCELVPPELSLPLSSNTNNSFGTLSGTLNKTLNLSRKFAPAAAIS